jgi:hypothetical protein
MDDWRLNSHNMLHRLQARRTHHRGDVPIWMKIRIDPTMPEHAIIDRYLENLAPADKDFEFEKHESGPELMAYLAAGAGLASAVIGLITAIIVARSQTHKRQELPEKPIELIVRRFDEEHGVTDEIIVRFGKTETNDKHLIEQHLMGALRKANKRKT